MINVSVKGPRERAGLTRYVSVFSSVDIARRHPIRPIETDSHSAETDPHWRCRNITNPFSVATWPRELIRYTSFDNRMPFLGLPHFMKYKIFSETDEAAIAAVPLA